MSDRLGDAVEDFAVVHPERHADPQLSEDPLDDLDQFDLVEQRARADNIDIALVEFAVAPLLRPVGTPYGLDLVALERQRDLGAVLHDIPRKGNGQVVPQALFADFRRLPQLFIGER